MAALFIKFLIQTAGQLFSGLFAALRRNQLQEARQQEQKEYDELQKNPSDFYAKHFNGSVQHDSNANATKTDIAPDSKK
ncbi:hypothetical protein [Piscirickettsia salmonis]|uniref:hypothetical protein n=1 Tax=Piscirickettsia salmonis TaxID=1238 RepID=UPI0007C90E59|nr:hypothetical protein A0O36_00390 [Piscirickettsiaceae bacterium NZ-RLO1]